ncbi:MAG: sulfur carrier protein ThiS [Leptospirales bacterium]
MKIQVNGASEEVREGATLFDYIKGRGLDPALVSVEHNGRIIEKEEWPNVVLRADDEIEVLFFMGGGM